MSRTSYPCSPFVCNSKSICESLFVKFPGYNETHGFKQRGSVPRTLWCGLSPSCGDSKGKLIDLCRPINNIAHPLFVWNGVKGCSSVCRGRASTARTGKLRVFTIETDDVDGSHVAFHDLLLSSAKFGETKLVCVQSSTGRPKKIFEWSRVAEVLIRCVVCRERGCSSCPAPFSSEYGQCNQSALSGFRLSVIVECFSLFGLARATRVVFWVLRSSKKIFESLWVYKTLFNGNWDLDCMSFPYPTQFCVVRYFPHSSSNLEPIHLIE